MRILATGLVAILSIVSAGSAQAADPAAATLAQARIDYETRMQAVRADTLHAIDRKADSGARPGSVNANLVREAGADKDEFRRTGAWPAVPEIQTLKDRAARITKDLQDAYARAIAAYTKLDDTPRRDALVSELDLFETYRDVVPWGPDLVLGLPEDRRTATPGTGPVVIAADARAEYRLDLAAKAGDEPADIEVVYPNAEGAFESVTVRAEARSALRLLLTIRNDAVVADLGLVRPAEFTEASTEPGAGSIVVTSKAGELTLTSARIKPIIDGAPDQIASTPPALHKPGITPSSAPASKPGNRSDEGDLLPVQSVWRGQDRRQSQTYSCVVRVVSRAEAGLAVIHVGHGNKAWDMDLKVKNGLLEITGVRPGNGVAAAIREGKGTGSVKGRDMVISYSWLQDLPSQGRMGNPVSGTIEVHRDNDR